MQPQDPNEQPAWGAQPQEPAAPPQEPVNTNTTMQGGPFDAKTNHSMDGPPAAKPAPPKSMKTVSAASGSDQDADLHEAITAAIMTGSFLGQRVNVVRLGGNSLIKPILYLELQNGSLMNAGLVYTRLLGPFGDAVIAEMRFLASRDKEEFQLSQLQPEVIYTFSV